GRWEIYTIDTVTGAFAPLTKDNGGSNFSPSWSPDGTQILFRKALGSDSQIWVMKADGMDQSPVTTGHVSDFDPVWSPDGQWIAFDRVTHGDSDLWVMKPDGSEQTDITNDPLTELQPSWSPDGRMIAFVRRTGTNTDIWKLSADGSSLQKRLTTTPADDTS